jgi:hypothetical protein
MKKMKKKKKNCGQILEGMKKAIFKKNEKKMRGQGLFASVAI